MNAELLTISGVCAKVGVSRWTWRKWVTAGKAPRCVPNVPGHPRWKAVDVARFIEGRHGLRYFGKRSKHHAAQSESSAPQSSRVVCCCSCSKTRAAYSRPTAAESLVTCSRS